MQKTSSSVFTIAVAHMHIAQDIKANSSTIQRLITQAANKGCRLIQFPEGALSGYCKTQITTWHGYDWPLLQKEFQAISNVARAHSIWVVLGSAYNQGAGKLPYNSLLVISDKGDVVVRYDKRFISHGELQGWYSPGKKAVTFTVDGLTFGLALCLEVQFYEIFDEYRRQNVDAVLLSAYADDPMFEVTARAHASLNNYWLGFSVPSNTPTPLHSSLIGPNGYIQEKSPVGANGLAIGSINPHDIRWDVPITKAKPWRKLARKGDIYNNVA